MGYQSRKRNYRSRRQKLKDSYRFWRVLSIFLVIGLLLWGFMKRHELIAWLKTYTY